MLHIARSLNYADPGTKEHAFASKVHAFYVNSIRLKQKVEHEAWRDSTLPSIGIPREDMEWRARKAEYGSLLRDGKTYAALTVASLVFFFFALVFLSL